MTKGQQMENSAPRRRRGVFSRFARGRGGVAAIEFAMVSIPLLGLICAIFETAFIYYTHEAFDYAVSKVARTVLINNYSSNSTQSASTFLTTYFCPQLPSFITCANVTLNVQAYNSSTTNFSTVASSINQSWYKTPSTNVNLGQPGYIVVFQAFYPMPVYLSVLVATGAHGNSVGNVYGQTSNTVFNNPNGSGFVHAIFSTAVFRNEPT